MEISRDLEEHHSVFYHLWQMGTPVFTDSIDTACVSFDEAGQRIGFMWNPEFYKKLDRYNRKFIICHECLHVILNHGRRAIGLKGAETDKANIAMDVVINELLVSKFGFERDKIFNQENLCWVDTVFQGRKGIAQNESFEYYYSHMTRSEEPWPVTLSLVDSHEGIASTGWGGVIDRLNKEISDEEKAGSLQDAIEDHFCQENPEENPCQAGTSPGGFWTFVDVGKVVRKKKWESVIKKWMRKYAIDLRSQEQWARHHRRMSLLPDDLFLPSEMEDEAREAPKKIEVWFFQDTSGSCIGLKDRFFRAAKSLPPSRFDVKMCCFDTNVYETTIESGKVAGGGGTSFSVIEKYIQQHCQTNKTPYPEAVFVITDGYGNTVVPQMPKRWFWFLSEKCVRYIPKESQTYMLADFE